jgi:ABC-2 type transport system permease protein
VCSPLTYFTDLARYSFTGAHFFPLLTDIAALAGFTLMFTVSVMYLHKKTMSKRM